MDLPSILPNRINGADAATEAVMTKFDPHTGKEQRKVARSTAGDVESAVASAAAAQREWGAMTAVARGKILLEGARLMKDRTPEIAEVVAAETGKAPKEAAGETGGGIQQAEYFAGEGMRLHGRSLQSGMPGKYTNTIREPHGVVGLIIAANTPIANVAWKVFPALVCGNAAVLKSAEDTPATSTMPARSWSASWKRPACRRVS